MPEQTPVPTEDSAAVEQSLLAGGRSSVLAKIKILLFVVVVIVVECALAKWWIPNASKTAAMAGATLGTDSATGNSIRQDGQQEEGDLADQIEVDLGEFTVTAYQPVSETTLRIDFHLWGMVHEKDYDEFLTLMQDNLHRFREQVHFTIRSADVADLTDAGLGLIKRKVLERTNKILGKPLLRVVIFDDFSFIEQ